MLRGLAQAVELRPAARARREVLLELGELGTVDRVERVRPEELDRFFVGDHASTPRTPASTKASRRRRMPLRMRLLTVPSGCSSTRATSRRCAPRSRPTRWPGARRRTARPWPRRPGRPGRGPRLRAACRIRRVAVRAASRDLRRRRELRSGRRPRPGRAPGRAGTSATTPVGIEAVGLVPQPEEHLLGDVLGLGGVVAGPAGPGRTPPRRGADRPRPAPPRCIGRWRSPAGHR